MRHFIVITLSLFILPLLGGAQNNPRNINLDWKTDLSQYTVSPDEFTALMPPDRIPPIDSPVFWDKAQAQKIILITSLWLPLKLKEKQEPIP